MRALKNYQKYNDFLSLSNFDIYVQNSLLFLFENENKVIFELYYMFNLDSDAKDPERMIGEREGSQN